MGNYSVDHKIEVIAPEVRPQVDDLPRAKTNQHAHSPKRKPLDPLIRTLIRIAELLLSDLEVIKLLDNLINHLLDAPEIRLDGLELLSSLDRIPILRVGPDVNVQLHVPFLGSHVRAVPAQNVLEAHVERAVRVRRERVPPFAHYVPGSRVLVAYRVVDPHVERLAVAGGFWRLVSETGMSGGVWGWMRYLGMGGGKDGGWLIYPFEPDVVAVTTTS